MKISFSAATAIAVVLSNLSLLSPTLGAEEEAKLGLAERRALKQYQETRFVELKKAIDTAATFELPLEVAWDKIARPGEAANYLNDDYWTKIFFQPLIDALKSITADEMGRESLKKHLKKVTLTFDDATAPSSNYPNGVKFADGTLALNFRPWSNADDVKARAEAIQKALEAGL